jgi:hypothetical protein
VRWKGTEMEPAQVFVALIGWALIVTAGYHVGKYKGRETAGLILTILLGLVGLVILACLPKTEAVKEAEARRQLPYAPPYPDPQYPYPPYQYPQQYPPQAQYPPQYPPPGPYPSPPPAPWDPPPS